MTAAPHAPRANTTWHTVYQWFRSGEQVALARVVAASDSVPHGPGAAMGFSGDGRVVGSISGGCVETELFAAAQRALSTGRAESLPLGPDERDADNSRGSEGDEDIWSIRLPCGGQIEVFIEPVGDSLGTLLPELVEAVHRDKPVALATRISAVAAHLLVGHEGAVGCLDEPATDPVEAIRELLVDGHTRMMGVAGETNCAAPIFVQSFRQPPRMLIFGADDLAAALSRIGRFLGYRVTVCDARATFATTERFPDAHDVVVDRPHRFLDAIEVHESTVVCVLTHDPKFDVPVLQAALRTDAAYIGAMGSRRTNADRAARLRAAGVRPDEIARLAAPIGLDLGGRTPEETAVSIAAEVVALARSGSGARLRDLGTSIHHR